MRGLNEGSNGMTVEEKIEQLARLCIASVSITYNEHTTNYESIEQYVHHQLSQGLIDNLPSDLPAMIEDSVVVEVHFYPNTPIGFYHLIGRNIGTLLDEAIEIAKEEN